MTVRTQQFTVTATAVRLASTTVGERDDPTPVVIFNVGAATIYVGGSDVTSAIGLPVGAGVPLSWDLEVVDEIWAVTASSTADVRVLRGES